MAMTPEEQKAFDDMKAERDSYKELADKATKPDPKPDPKTGESEDDLRRKVQADNDAKAKKDSDAKSLEAALSFSLTSDKFIAENKSLLPKEIEDIFSRANKEKYDSAVDKANDIKSAIIQSFFSLQANIDLLTPSHKQDIDDYLKLTKNGKREKAQEMYNNVFEPALSILKNVKKAEELSRARNGQADGTDLEKSYKEKLMGLSRKHYLGEK